MGNTLDFCKDKKEVEKKEEKASNVLTNVGSSKFGILK